MTTPQQTSVSEATPRIPLAWGLVLFGVIALFGNAMGLWLRYPEFGAAVLFPPYAALTTALLLSQRRDWIWYIAVSVAAHALPLRADFSVSWMLIAEAANITRALVAALLLRRFFRGVPRLVDMPALALFIGIAVTLAPAVGATIGATNVILHGGPSYWRVWTAWLLSNALTGLTVLPMFIAAANHAASWRRRIERRRVVEALVIAIGIGASSAAAFLMPYDEHSGIALQFLAPLPVLIWTALRVGAGGASVALTAVAVTAIIGADRGTGPFLASSPGESVLALQIFLLLTTIQILSIAAIATGRRRAVQLYRALLSSLQEQVAVLDGRGVVLAVNESWRRSGDRSSERHFEVGIGDDFISACRTAAQTGDPAAGKVLCGVESVLGQTQRRFETEYAQDDGTQHAWYAVSAQALERAGGGAVVTRVDVSARHEAESEIERQRRELSHLARVAVLGQLSGALAHELRQPLASILGNAEAAQYLLRRPSVDVQKLDAILRDIVAEDHRASEVMTRLRALLRQGETHRLPVDANELVREVLSLAHAELMTRRVTASAFVEPHVALVLGDRIQLQQVLLNLILNGCEAMAEIPPDERELTLTVRTTSPIHVQISVKDMGTGIADALRDRLFEPFVTSKTEGLGLGLSLSRTIVAAHGGRLWAENNPGPGATLFVLLPAPQSESTGFRGADLDALLASSGK